MTKPLEARRQTDAPPSPPPRPSQFSEASSSQLATPATPGSSVPPFRPALASPAYSGYERSMRYVLPLFLLCGLACMSTPSPSPVQAAPADGTLVNMSAGYTIRVPSNWQSSPADASRLAMVAPDGLTMAVVMYDAGSLGDVQKELQRPMDLGGGVVLTPTSTPIQSEDGWSVDATVTGTTLPALGVVVVRPAGNAHLLAVIGIFPVSSAASQRPIFFTIANSATFAAPTPTGNDWNNALKGQYLVRFYSGNQYHEKHELWLCSDGSYARADDGGGASMDGFSGVFSGGSVGTWSATGGVGEAGVLTLIAQDGSRKRLTLTMGADGVYLDGTRWMRAENSRCR